MGKAKSTRSPNLWSVMLDTPGLQTKDRAPRRVTETGADDVPHRQGSAGASAAGGPGDHRRAATGPGDHAAAGLSWRRLLIASALVLLLPGALAILAIRHRAPESPPVQTATSFDVLAQVPDTVLRAQLDRSRTVFRLIGKLAGPALLDPATTGTAGPGALPTLALTPRMAPYTLGELRQLVPAAFTDIAADTGAALLLTANLQVPFGARLIIDGQTPDVRLTSTPSGFATIISRGTVSIAGDATHPVRISSWDPERGTTDENSADGRSFIVQSGGRMDANHAVFSYLGFNVGISSGVAWSGAPVSTTQPLPVNAEGDVRSSMFLHNHFGAYTRRAQGMQWVGNTFADNEEYGFDPHDFSNDFLVQGNVAFGNGKHGFIFSRGCAHNTLRDNISHDNGGHGFMIDDGRSRPSTAAMARINGSSGNVLTNNTSFNNAGNGIEIEGGTANVVTDNRVSGNYVGIQVKDDAAVTVRDNTISDNVWYGIDVRNIGAGADVVGNTITASWGAVNLATADSAAVGANISSDVSAPLVVAGVAIRDTSWTDSVLARLQFSPMLLLWTLLLGVPIVVTVIRLSWSAARPRRRARTA
jgi:parallel beta-helix repeat protein